MLRRDVGLDTSRQKGAQDLKEAASQGGQRQGREAEARWLKLQLLADRRKRRPRAARACFNGEDEAAARIIRRQPSLVTEVDEDGLSLLGSRCSRRTSAACGCCSRTAPTRTSPRAAAAAARRAATTSSTRSTPRCAEPRGTEAATALVRLLLEHSADPNYNGCDALKHACLFGPIKCVKLLLDAKGTPDASHVSSVVANTADTVRPPPACPPSRPAAAAPPRRRRRPPPPTPPPPPSQVAAVVLGCSSPPEPPPTTPRRVRLIRHSCSPRTTTGRAASRSSSRTAPTARPPGDDAAAQDRRRARVRRVRPAADRGRRRRARGPLPRRRRGRWVVKELLAAGAPVRFRGAPPALCRAVREGGWRRRGCSRGGRRSGR